MSSSNTEGTDEQRFAVIEGLLAPHEIVVAPKPRDIFINITMEGTKATPAIASMVGRLLQDMGASVTYSNDNQVARLPVRTLEGLHINFERTVWIREEEAERKGINLN